MGLLVRLLPEWAAVRCRPQRNAYHRFTVDRHLCEAAAGAAEHAGDVDRPDLLLVGTWLHDIGKGFVGVRGDDHTDGRRGGDRRHRRPHGVRRRPTSTCWSPWSATTCCCPTWPPGATSTTRPPSTAVADQVGDRRLLGLLHLLTVADSQATGPAAWSPWKAGLVDELVDRVDRFLSGNDTPRGT